MLAMAHTAPARGGLTLDTLGASMSGPGPEIINNNYSDPQSGYSTPTSVFSATPSSPMIPSAFHSPAGRLGYAVRGMPWGDRSASRRLSVPSTQHIQQPGYGPPGSQYMTPVASSAASTFSPAGSGYGTPVSSVFSDSIRDSGPEPDLRRRTWHPSTGYGPYGTRPATSGLSYYQTPDTPQPVAASQPAAAQAIRLPGIDSFDCVRAQPIAPPRRPPSSMEIDPKLQASHADRGQTLKNDIVSPRDSWNSINRGLTQLEIARAPPEPSTRRAPIHPAQQGAMTRPFTFPYPSTHLRNRNEPAPAPLNVRFSQPSVASDDSVAARRKKRQAWYNGPVPNAPGSHTATALRTSPEDSSSSEGVPTPSSNYVAEYHPAIVHGNSHSNGYIEALAMEDPRKVSPKATSAHFDQC